MKLTVQAALFERFVVAVERIADALTPQTVTGPRKMPDILTAAGIPKAPAPPVHPPVAGYELCECGHVQMFHAAGKGPCQRCQGDGACPKFRGTWVYAAEEVPHREFDLRPRVVDRDPKPQKVHVSSTVPPQWLPDGEWKPDKQARAMLEMLARRHPRPTSDKQLSVWTGYRMSGGWRNNVAALRAQGLIEGPKSGRLLTALGLRAYPSNPLPRGWARYEFWKSHRDGKGHPRLDQQARLMIEKLMELAPQGATQEALAEYTGYETSGGWRNNMALLRALELIVGERGAELRAAEELAS